MAKGAKEKQAKPDVAPVAKSGMCVHRVPLTAHCKKCSV